ncbi:FG-GAP repeat domain-containing protein [Haloarchaeobius sp. TZWSO28]|uniref:FG-GAP repeat domain-containing protein n=1 Tax=Haloarchaeobius sp. TZWSO28 TaxID=3446119 RepID=UPI003EBD1287
MKFRHERVDPEPPGISNVICLPVDLTGNGRDDIIVGAKDGAPTLYWYENTADGWERHDMATAHGLEAGGVIGDVDGDGRVDVIAGQKWDCHEAYWFRQPTDPRDPWTTHLITDEFQKYHDQAFADVDDDGEPEVVLLSQKSGVLLYYDVPTDPTVEPWPTTHRHVVSRDVWDVEGLVCTDIDGDGRTEIVAGSHVFHRHGPDDWEPETLVTSEWNDERVRNQVADLTGDGAPDLVLAECELPYFGPRRELYRAGRLAWFEAPDWEVHYLKYDLFCPHSLQIADFDGDGRPDIYVAESDLGENPSPEHYVYRNLGGGEFEAHLVHQGTPTHEAKVADLTGDGRPDIVGKDDSESGHVDVWYNES